MMSLIEFVFRFMDRWTLQRQAEAELTRLQAIGWTQEDFARELERLLTSEEPQ